MEYYSNNNGVVFFEVYEDKLTDENTIYYLTFAPAEAKLALTHMDKKKKSFKLKKMRAADLWKILNRFYQQLPELSRQVQIVSIEDLKYEENFIGPKFHVAVGNESKTFKPGEVTMTGSLNGKPVIVDYEGITSIKLAEINFIDVTFPNGHKIKGVVYERDEHFLELKVGGFLTLEMRSGSRNKSKINLNYQDLKKDDILEDRLTLFEAGFSFLSNKFVWLKPNNADKFKFDLVGMSQVPNNLLHNLSEHISYLKKLIWSKNLLGKSYFDVALDEESLKNFESILEYYPENVDKSEKDSIFFRKILDDIFLFSFQNGELISAFDDRSLFNTDSLVVGSSADPKDIYPQGNPFVLVDVELWKMPQYDKEMVFRAFDFSVNEIPAWYHNTVTSNIVLAYIKAYDVTEDESWLRYALKVIDEFLLKISPNSIESVVNKAQIGLRMSKGIPPKSAVFLDDLIKSSQDSLSKLMGSIIFDDFDSFKKTWATFDRKSKTEIAAFPIFKLCNNKMNELIDSEIESRYFK